MATIDERTPRLNLPLPVKTNALKDDCDRLRETISTLDTKVATVDESGKVPVGQLPAVAITDTFPVSSQAAMLALVAEPGDVAIRSDISKSFILMAAPASVLANWKELLSDALAQLATTAGATKVKASSGKTVQQELDDVDAALSTFSGALTGTPEDTAVPSHSDADLGEALNAQSQALLNRQEKFKQDLGGAGGTALVKHSMPGSTTSRSTKDVLSDRAVSPVDYGAVDDYNGTTGTNNLTAFKKAFEQLNTNGGGDLYLPKNGTGRYFINGDDATQVQHPVRICADEGVSIHLIYSGGQANSPLANTTKLSADRQVKMEFVNYGFTSFIGENMGRELGEILPTINNGDGVFSAPTSLAGSDFKILRLSNLLAEVSPVSSAPDSITYAGAGVPTAGVISASPGDEIMSLLSSPSGGIFFAGVITVNGYAYFSQTSASGSIFVVDYTAGMSDISMGVPYSLMDQQRDLFNNAVLSVKVTSDRSFSVLVNGLVVGSYTTRSSILGACFGSENINNNVSLSQMSKVTGRSFGGSKPLRIVVSGDSISDNAVQYSWVKYLQMVLGSAGINISTINNIAVAGQTAAQQYTSLQTVGVGYDLCLIQVGVNDIQGATNFSAFVTTIQNMVTYAKSVGMQPIVGIPTAFYSKAEANVNGQTGGQDTQNNATMHTYRALLIRAVADAGGLVNLEPMKAYGAMTAKWLSLTPYAVSDRIVVDNIHPSPYGSMMLAQGWARAIVGYLNRPDTSNKEQFDTMPTAWISSGFGTTDRPLVRGRKLKGVISLHTTLSSDGSVAFKLPPSIKISAVKMVTVTCINASNLPVGVANMYIGTNGNCYFFNLAAGTTKISVDDVEV